MNRSKKHRLAAIIAFIIGLLSIKAGMSVLLGISAPTYPVLQWLVIYNVALGIISLAAGIGIWTQQKWSSILSIVIASMHGLVFVTLASIFALQGAVAPKSIMAMLFRTTVWIVILLLIVFRKGGQERNADTA